MNIGIFVPNCNQGGTERVATRLVDLFSEMGHNCIIITLCQNRFPYHVKARVEALDILAKKSKLFRMYGRYSRLKQLLRENKIDVVLSMGELPNVLNALMPTRYLRIARITNSFSSLKNSHSLLKLLTRYAYNNLNSIIVPAEYLRFELSEMFNLSDKIITINNLLDFKSIPVIELESSRTKRIVHIGQLVEQKGQHHLLEAFSIVSRKVKDVELVIIGKGELKPNLVRLAEKLGIANRVRFLGWQDNPFYWLQNSDVFALTSLWEGMPNVMIESMACMCPVVSFNCPSGPDEIISKPGENGILVDVGDIEGFSNALIKLLQDERYHLKVSEAAYERAKDFGVDILKNKYKSLLRQ